MPELCEAGENSKRIARMIELAFLDEQTDETGVFAQNEYDKINIDNRTEVLFGFKGNEKKKDLCRDIVTLEVVKHRIEKHGDDLGSVKEILEANIANKALLPENEDIMLASSQISPMGFWTD